MARCTDGSGLVPREVLGGRGSETNPYYTLRQDLLRVSPARPLRAKAGTVASDARTTRNLAAFARRTGGEPLVPWLTTLRYRGAGSVDDSYVAR